jgi:hypothetical protein
VVDAKLGKPVESSLQGRAPKWHGRTTTRAISRPRINTAGPSPLLAEFLEEQLWALRDRTETLMALSLPEPLAKTLALVGDELTEAALLLRRPARTNREGVTILLGQLRTTLENVEREAWPAWSPR